MLRRLFAPSLFVAAALALPIALAGCGGSSPYVDEDAEATEGTGETPDGAVNRSLNPGDAGTVGPGNLEGEPDGDEAGMTAEDVMNDPTTDVAAEPVTAKPVSYEEFRKIVEAAEGPVLVDCWADWCMPCREAFPHTVALAEKRAEDGLTVVSLAFNNDQEADAVNEFLTDVSATPVTNLRTGDGGDTEAWEPLEVSALPTLLIFNADGEEIGRIVGGGPAAEAELDAKIASALEG